MTSAVVLSSIFMNVRWVRKQTVGPISSTAASSNSKSLHVVQKGKIRVEVENAVQWWRVYFFYHEDMQLSGRSDEKKLESETSDKFLGQSSLKVSSITTSEQHVISGRNDLSEAERLTNIPVGQLATSSRHAGSLWDVKLNRQLWA